MDIKNVHLWHGRKDPYLYTVDVALTDGDEVIVKVIGNTERIMKVKF